MIKQCLLAALICLALPLPANDIPFRSKYYDVPEGYHQIEPCNQEEVLSFWKMLQNRGALIREKIRLESIEEGKVRICNYSNRLYDLILCETGEMDVCSVNSTAPIQGEGTCVLYKGNLCNDGQLCYMLVSLGNGWGYYDYILDVWKIVDDRIEKMSFHENLADTFFPGSDAHLFYGYLADPFLVEKEGKIFMRWVDGYFGDRGNGAEGVYTYCWEKGSFYFIPSLSQDQGITANEKRAQYMAWVRECQNNALSEGNEAISSVDFETLKEFIYLQNNTDLSEKYPRIFLSNNGYFSLKKDLKASWNALRLKSDVTLLSEDDSDLYILYRGDFFNDGRDVFILVQTYSSLMFHDFPDEISAWEVSQNQLKRIPLKCPTNCVANPFITKNKGKYHLHFMAKSMLYNLENDPDFRPYTIICESDGNNLLKPVKHVY